MRILVNILCQLFFKIYTRGETFHLLLVARYSLLFDWGSLLFARCLTRNSEGFFLSKSKQKVLHINLYKQFSLQITWKLGWFETRDFQQSLWVLKTKQPESFLFRVDIIFKFYIKHGFVYTFLRNVFCAHFCSKRDCMAEKIHQ